jgi:hypothetical protein
VVLNRWYAFWAAIALLVWNCVRRKVVLLFYCFWKQNFHFSVFFFSPYLLFQIILLAISEVFFLLNILMRADFSFFLKFLLLKLLKILIPMILFERKSLQLRVCQLKIFDSQLFLKLLMLIECKRHRWSIKLSLLIIFRVANTAYLVLFSFILFFYF